jgi:putative FmdB family regulatory protein
MPTYEFTCKICGIRFDKSFHFKGNLAEVLCSNGHPQNRQIFTTPNIQYEGSGFYPTDRRKKEKNQKSNTDGHVLASH